MDKDQIIEALIAEGFEDTREATIAALEDMGMDEDDLEELWELGGEG